MMVTQTQVVAQGPEVDGQERYLGRGNSRPWGWVGAGQREGRVQVTPSWTAKLGRYHGYPLSGHFSVYLRFCKTRALGFPGSFTLLPDAPRALRVVKEGPGKLEESQRTLGTDQI